jgi:hypothetical protein
MKYFVAIIFFIPLTAFAATAGTDSYLRELGYSEEQLTRAVATEDREAFKMAEGTGRVEDPLGDVLNRWGQTSGLNQPWGDIQFAVLTKNETAQTWDFTVTLGGQIPDKPTTKAQLFIVADTDGKKPNNDIEGIRIGADAEFSVQHNAERGWYADFRWYNPEADFWAMNKETAMTFDLAGNAFTIHIPFSEMSADITPHWRVGMGLADGEATELDAAPGVGFPPPKGETYPEAPDRFYAPTWLNWAGWIVVAVVAGYGACRTLAKRPKV